jgi:hypothetical protein
MTDTLFQEVLAWHAQRYPRWQVQDIYKLIYQAALGSEHAVPSREFAQTALEQELAALTAGYSEPLIEPIHPVGDLVRLHLRTLLHQNRSPIIVLDAFVQTALEYKGSYEALDQYAGQAIDWVREIKRDIDPWMLQDFLTSMREERYPAVHHSAEYIKEYLPAYRVIATRFLPSTWVRF